MANPWLVFYPLGIFWEFISAIWAALNLFSIVSGIVDTILLLGAIFFLIFLIDLGYFFLFDYDEAWTVLLRVDFDMVDLL